MAYEEELRKEIENIKEEIAVAMQEEDYLFVSLLLGNLQALDEETWLSFGLELLNQIE